MRFYQIRTLNEEQQVDEVRMGSSDFAKFLQTPLAKEMKAGFEAEVIFSGLASGEDDGEWEPDYDQDERARSIDDIIDFFSSGDFSDLGPRAEQRLRDQLSDDWSDYTSERMNDVFYEDEQSNVREYIEDNFDDSEILEDYLSGELGLSESEIEELFILKKEYRRLYSTKQKREFIEEHPEFEKFVEAEKAISDTIEEKIDELVEEAIENHNDDWDGAYEQFMDNWDGADQEEWLDSRGWRYMTDISNAFDLSWPHMYRVGGDEGGFNEGAAGDLADSLARTLEVETTVSGGYHSARRDESTWIFEPDSSLEPDDGDDMPVEIVSPPMPLDKTVEIIPKFFEWVKDNGGYVNDSTGFHMSVSMPKYDPKNLDFVKLALFLGDEYVLKQFGREANYYTRSAIQKIKERTPKTVDQFAQFIDKMKEGLEQIGKNNVAGSDGFGKYTSINPKTGYVEFRSAGGSNYMDDMKRLQDTLARYGMALSIATDPAAERREYAKKLYKLLSTGVKSEDDVIKLFSLYVAKELPTSALKSHLKNLRSGREKEKSKKDFKYDDSKMPPLDWANNNYEIYNVSRDSTVYPFSASSPDEALSVLNLWRSSVMSPNLEPSNFLVRPVRQSGSSSTTVDQDPADNDYPFYVTYSVGEDQRRSNYRVNARNQAEARQKFLQVARQSMDLDRITIHQVTQLGG